jgi:hypothetical protein
MGVLLGKPGSAYPLPVRPAVPPDMENAPVRIAADVPEADAIEQSLPGPLPDEDEAPR